MERWTTWEPCGSEINIMSIELWTFATPNGWKVTIMIEELIEAGIELPGIDIRHHDAQHGSVVGQVLC